MLFKLKENDFIRCVTRIPNEQNIRVGDLYKVRFFVNKDSHEFTREIQWKNRFSYWFYMIGDNGKAWKQDPIYFELNKKKIRREKVINLLKLMENEI